MSTILQDLRYAFRMLRRAPGFAVVAIATMAVGVGANAAIFTIVNAALLRPLPFSQPNDLVMVWQQNLQTRETYGDASPANFRDWRVRNRSFAGMAAERGASFNISSGDRPERVTGAIVNTNFFQILGVTPALGRGFTAADEKAGAARVAILGDGLWRQLFGARGDIVGGSLRIDEEMYTIIGVMPPGIEYPDEAQIWISPHWSVPDDPLTLGQDPSEQRDHAYFEVVARLLPGVSLRQAQADMDRVAASIRRDYPESAQNLGVGVVSLSDELVKQARPTLLMLLVAVGLLLLIAAANVSGLLIARAIARHQEIAIRVALGASRRRIVGQLLTESVLLALIGGSAGVLVATWLVTPLAALSPSDLGLRSGNVEVDTTVLLFGLVISTAAGLIFGMAPARQALRSDVHNDLKQTARGGGSAGQNRTRSALVCAEIALSLVLLVAAGLTIKSFIRLQHVPTGFEPDHVLTLGTSLSAARYPTPEKKSVFWERALEELRQAPGVTSVGATSRLPLAGGNSTRGVTIDGHDVVPPLAADYRTASPDYFRALGIPLVRGRTFTDQDRENRALVTIISASMAARLLPGVDPIGHQVAIDPERPMTIVGVVGDVHHASLAADPRPTFYAPYRQDPWPFMTFVMRTNLPPSAVAGEVRQAIWRVDKDQPVAAVLTMDDRLSASVARRRFSVMLLALFGGVAVVLAAIGLYGVLAFVVIQRRREIGVRMALGATPRAIVQDVLRYGLGLTLLGMVVGIGLALAVTRLLSSLLFGTSATDLTTFTGVALLLILVAACASLIPALRASRVDPLVALRDE